MTFSRMHMGLLGVVSLFTGIISPVVRDINTALPFPLTDMQVPAYVILILLSIICILLTVRSWAWARFFGFFILTIIGYLFIVAWNGEVRSLTGIPLGSTSWGWVFIFIGSGLIIACMFSDEKENRDIHTSISDHMIGWLSAITILVLTGVVISISYISKQEYSNNKNILKTIFGTGGIESHSGLTASSPYKSINNLTFDRKYDSINFYTSSGSKMISIPDGISYDRLPYMKTTIGDISYTINADGSIISDDGLNIGKAILPQQVEQSILAQSGIITFALTNNGIQTYSGVFTEISDVTTINSGEHIVWKVKSGTGYNLYRDGVLYSQEKNNISNISISTDGKSIMYLTKESDGSSYIVKNGNKIEKIEKGYIEGSIKLNGNDSIYTIEHDGTIEIIHNGKLLDRKFDEIREIFIERNSDGFVYFGRPLGEKTYCLYTSYRGNLCGLSGYMNPRLSPDGTSIIYAGLKDGAWGIYRNATPIIRNTGYPNRENISQDYVFFDVTNPSYYLFIRHMDNGYGLYTKGRWIDGIWKDVGLDVTFGYDNKIIMSAQDEKGWRILEF